MAFNDRGTILVYDYWANRLFLRLAEGFWVRKKGLGRPQRKGSKKPCFVKCADLKALVLRYTD